MQQTLNQTNTTITEKSKTMVNSINIDAHANILMDGT